MCYDRAWGTVCSNNDNLWTNENTQVVCRQLGYPVEAGGMIIVVLLIITTPKPPYSDPLKDLVNCTVTEIMESYAQCHYN